MRCEARYPFRMARDLSLTGLLTSRLDRDGKGRSGCHPASPSIPPPSRL